MQGESLFVEPQAVSKWDAYEFLLKKGSEHTINGKRYDLEL